MGIGGQGSSSAKGRKAGIETGLMVVASRGLEKRLLRTGRGRRMKGKGSKRGSVGETVGGSCLDLMKFQHVPGARE